MKKVVILPLFLFFFATSGHFWASLGRIACLVELTAQEPGRMRSVVKDEATCRHLSKNGELEINCCRPGGRCRATLRAVHVTCIRVCGSKYMVDALSGRPPCQGGVRDPRAR